MTHSALPPDAKRILLVDDDEAIKVSVRAALWHEGYAVESAADGDEALLKNLKFKPDAIILDVMMPKENGYRVSRAIKLQRAPRNVVPKVLLCTARRPDTAERERMFLEFSQADGVIYKPFRLEELMERVRSLLSDN